jgi:1-acyl-sn-glycerol-3-phosphate acyltransferase
MAPPRKRGSAATKTAAPKTAAAKTGAPKTAAAKTGAAKTGAAKTGAAKTGAGRTAATASAADRSAAPKKNSATGTAAKARSPKAASAAVGSPRRTTTRDALAAGAARASGERARRRGTPLVAVPDLVDAPAREPETATPTTTASTITTAAGATTGAAPTRATVAEARKHRPRPAARSPKPAPKFQAREGGRRTEPPRPIRPLRPVPDARSDISPSSAQRLRAEAASRNEAVHTEASRPRPRPEVVRPGEASRTVFPGLEDLVQAGVAALRTVVAASGVEPEEVERQVASTLAFLRRRLTGDFEVDDFGFDEDFTVNAYLPLLRPLYKTWFRVEVRGIENIPAVGGGLVVSNHSGTLAMDSLMTQVAVYDETPTHRHLRMLGADFVFQTPVVSQIARKSGSTLAANSDAERLLGGGELVGVWPEGFKGIGKPFSERYKLQRFGRGGFVASAIRAGVPIIPCSIVGAEEIYPMIGNMKTFARLIGAPYAPVTPTWPLLGPLGLVPLPSKWLIEFGAPVQTSDLGHGAADDPMLIFDLTDQTRETIQQTLYSLLMQRRSVFF